jgi:sugar lactone lactonase YvrE
MNTRLISLAGALALIASNALANPSSALERIALPKNGAYPNGIAHAEDGTLYVGQITQGGVLRRNPAGEWSTLHAGAQNIYAGTSLRLDEERNVLWGASPDFLPEGQPRTPHIFAINTESGDVLQVLPITEGFGNDIAVEPAGSILITESIGGRLLRLQPGSSEFETVMQDDRLTHESGIGAGGIALANNGTVAIGNFSSGQLFLYENEALRELQLPRRIENPDGMRFAPDGSLIVLESAAETGNGRVLRIPDPFAAGERRIEVVAEGLKSPVNLTVADDNTAYVSESHVRHRLVRGLENQRPDAFHVVVVPLG